MISCCCSSACTACWLRLWIIRAGQQLVLERSCFSSCSQTSGAASGSACRHSQTCTHSQKSTWGVPALATAVGVWWATWLMTCSQFIKLRSRTSSTINHGSRSMHTRPTCVQCESQSTKRQCLTIGGCPQHQISAETPIVRPTHMVPAFNRDGSELQFICCYIWPCLCSPPSRLSAAARPCQHRCHRLSHPHSSGTSAAAGLSGGQVHPTQNGQHPRAREG